MYLFALVCFREFTAAGLLSSWFIFISPSKFAFHGAGKGTVRIWGGRNWDRERLITCRGYALPHLAYTTFLPDLSPLAPPLYTEIHISGIQALQALNKSPVKQVSASVILLIFLNLSRSLSFVLPRRRSTMSIVQAVVRNGHGPGRITKFVEHARVRADPRPGTRC